MPFGFTPRTETAVITTQSLARLSALLTCLFALALSGCNDDATAPLVAPRLVVLTPEAGATLRTPTPLVTFRVDGAPVSEFSVRVGRGTPTTTRRAIGAGEEVSVPITVTEGLNTLELSVADEHGQGDTATWVLLYERSSGGTVLVPPPPPASSLDPVVLFESPAAGAFTFGAEVAVRGRVLSARSITASLRVDDGDAAPVTLTKAEGGYTFAAVAPVALGSHTLSVTAKDDLGATGEATVAFSREIDTAPPAATLLFPRADQAVKTRRVLVRGTVQDNHDVASVSLSAGGATIPASVDAQGQFSAWLDLEPASNEFTVHAKDASGNESSFASSVYYGQRLGAGGAFGGIIRDGRLFTWGRNNLGQTGLDYVSHESRTAFCDRTLTAGSPDVTWCKAASLANAQAICDAARGTGTAEALQCRSDHDAKRAAVCSAAGAAAPTNCATSTSANLMTACEAAYGVGSSAAASCKVGLVCDGAYDAATPEHDACAARVSSTPNVFPSPATPYAATRITKFSPAAQVAAPADVVDFDALGVTFVSLAFNQNAASALDSEGRVWGWGDGGSGVLCLGDVENRQIPHRALDFGEPGTRAVALSRGYDHVLILRSDGSVWACGQNNVGQIGDGTSGAAANRALPTRVEGLPSDVIQVAASSQSSYALTRGGLVYAWGRNQYGNLGQGTASTATAAQATPLLVPGLTDVVVLANGRDHVLAARNDGSVYAWGLNGSNQVGPGDGNVLSPAPVANVTNAVAVYGNGNQGFYQDALGRLFGWGQNGNTANLGIPDSADQPTPTVPVFGLSELTDVAIGATHGYAMKGTTVFAWGWSFHGSLGAGSSAIHTWGYRTPLLVQFAP